MLYGLDCTCELKEVVMRSTRFIPTPVNTQEHSSFIEDIFERDQIWKNRARKLRERRWRKLANKLAANEQQRHLHHQHRWQN